MMRVWKYELHDLNSVKDDVYKIVIRTRKFAVPLRVMIQNGIPCLWVEVDDSTEEDDLVLFCVGTGHGRALGTYIDSVIVGPYVWHLYW